jgi:NADH-ubiquinone oxidoreductase chain 2
MIFISILTLIVAKALPVLSTNISSVHFTRITSIVFLYTSILILNSLNLESIGSGLGIYSGLFHITQTTQIIELFLFTIGGLILIGWPQIKKEGKIIGESYSTDYSLIVLFSILGSALLVSSYDLISIYLSIELQSFGLYILSTLYRDSESSTAAGLKYFLLGGLSSCIILLGCGIIYSYSGITNLESLYIINSISDFNQPSSIQGLSLGLILIFIGFLFKVAAAPLHNWSPDVYDGTPTIVTIWLTIIPKIAILILLLELQTQFGIIGGSLSQLEITITSISDIINTNIIGFSAAPVIKNLLLISSLLSLIIGSILGLAQTKIKRLLAYSTISHIGFLLLALAINSEQSVDSFIFYLIQYTITNLNIFLILLAFSYLIYNNNYINLNNVNIKDLNYILEFKGLFFSNPFLSISLGLSLFSMAGVPPLIGFFSKQFVLYSSLQNGYYFISIIAIIVSVISASYYLKIIKLLFTYDNSITPTNISSLAFTTNSKERAVVRNDKEKNNDIILSNTHSFIISTLTFIITLFFIKPSIILNSTQLLALSLFFN